MLTSELDFVQNKSEIHFTENGEKIQHEHRRRNIILSFLKASREDKCTGK